MIDVIVIGFERPVETFDTIKMLLDVNDDIRVILIHDGSVHRPCLDDLDNSKITQVRIKHSGQPKALNVGLGLVKSEYVVIMHNDILIKDVGWIGNAVKFLRANKEAGLVCSLGWQVIYNGLLHSPFHSVSSLKNLVNCENHSSPKEDFKEVWKTDSHINIFKTGIKADERYGLVGASFWVDVKAKGLKCYVMRFDDSLHILGSSKDLEVYKKLTTHAKERLIQVEVTDLRMEEHGIKLPTEKELKCL